MVKGRGFNPALNRWREAHGAASRRHLRNAFLCAVVPQYVFEAFDFAGAPCSFCERGVFPLR